jgi:hypothetical protein
VYEGPEVLRSLLQKAGSPQTAEEVAAAFSRAVKAGEPRAEVIPTFFPQEPRFGSPEEARRLYANLFGLWDRIAAGLGPHDDAPEVVPEPPPPPPLPERGAVPGTILPADLVEAVWKHLAAGPPREVQRARDVYENGQPDVVAFLEAIDLPEAGGAAALDLAFEAWAMFDRAFGERLGTVEFRDLRELAREPPPVDVEQPALAAYVGEQLDVLEDEDEGFGADERVVVERAVAAVIAALTRAVQEPS